MLWHVAVFFCWSLLIFLQFDKLVESRVWALSGSHPCSDVLYRWSQVGIPGHCNLKKLEETVKAALAARQCSVSAASFSEGSLILRYGEAVTVGAARRWADRVVTPIAYDWKVPIALGDAKCVKLWWRRQDGIAAMLSQC